MANDSNLGSNVAFLLVTATVLIAGIVCSVLWVGSLPSRATDSEGVDTVADTTTTTAATGNRGFLARFQTGRKTRLTPTPVPVEEELASAETEEAEAPAAAAEEAEAAPPTQNLDEVIAAINTGGCTACHTIPGIPNAVGQVGPNLSDIGVDGASRREGYTAEAYIRESIMEPNAFTAPECPTGPCIAGAMPVVQLSDAQLEAIVGYLTTLGVDEVSMATK